MNYKQELILLRIAELLFVAVAVALVFGASGFWQRLGVGMLVGILIGLIGARMDR